MKLNQKQQKELITDFKQAVSDYYGERLAKVILYGSYARGDYREDSDIDFLVVLNDNEIKKYREIIDLTAIIHPLILKHDISISFQPYSEKKFNKEKSPFLHWVRKQGIQI